jgi:hypothetical protein
LTFNYLNEIIFAEYDPTGRRGERGEGGGGGRRRRGHSSVNVFRPDLD